MGPSCALLLATCLAMCTDTTAGPLGASRENALATADVGCTVGDVVYTVDDEIPGSSACERCKCGEGGALQCGRVKCEPRPGCKAIHRPDHCCPTYQCECEQGGRVYGNGEKLVDATEPCRVCYCQGGEVVCRKVACFLRDDCKPRLVPGRCCPEYDNCPIRGVTSLPGLVTVSANESDAEPSSPPASVAPPDKLKQEITIKEITPISEIPIISGVHNKDMLPTTSSKSPLMVREVSTTTTTMVPLTTEGPTSTERPTTSGTPATTKPPSIEDEDSSLFDHNPAFPPIPDDLSVLSNRGDEIVPETSMDNTEAPAIKNSPMLNLRAAIPTEILNLPAAVPDEIDGQPDEEDTTSVHQHEDATTTPKVAHEHTTSSIDKSNIATEVTAQPEISSLPIEASSAPAIVAKRLTTTTQPDTQEATTETTLAPPEMTTEDADVPTSPHRKNDVLADLIDLVGDVASIGDHGDPPPPIPQSEELILVNNNVRHEIEDVDDAPITDAPPPGDNVEPTTRTPIIDNVNADDKGANKTNSKEIEIITHSYVPTINRRPTKVVLGAH